MNKTEYIRNKPQAIAGAVLPQDLRRLEANELVGVGDFVADEDRGFELWEGPSGFRADAFIRPIYRRNSPLLRQEKIRLIEG